MPLDRIATTDVWATDTMPANLPPMEEFKARMDQWIWDEYRIEVEHLCARNPDGSKRTYEQMFYHVPKRKSGGYSQGTILGYPDLWNPWCQAALKRNAKPQSTGNCYGVPTQHPVQLVSEAQTCTGCHSGLPVSRETMVPRRPQGSYSDTKVFRSRSLPGAGNSRSTMSEHLSQRAPPRGAKKKYRGILRHRSRRACPVRAAE